jgi:hypothetical protein
LVSTCNGAYVFGGQFTGTAVNKMPHIASINKQNFIGTVAQYQLKEEAELNERILDNLAKVKVDG